MCTVTILDDAKRELQEAFSVYLTTTTDEVNLLTSKAEVAISENDNS